MGCVTNLLASAAVPHPVLVQLADLDENKVTPGLLGFVVFALIGGATWFLMKSMNKQLKRIDFDPAGQTPAPASGDEAAASSSAAASTSSGSADGKS